MASTDLLRSPIVQNAAAATAAGAGVFLRPARLPKWGRRGLRLANTAGTAGSVFLASRGGSDDGGDLGTKPTRTRAATAASAGSAIAAAAGGLTLISSGFGLKMDARAEKFLVGKGIKHPRIWMAVGTVVIVFAAKQAQDYGTKKAEAAARKQLEKQQKS
ncbi:hypothetical protein [Allobranchiibius sp. GilTou73]|uniref:hypothetical protein n=1 Tax=Allobranchiibius sp. GilTou73 TaxID=2904523 RepID=UPI001F2E6605|nr:hypothetical protein [Allobranchiibius sp. GilTou73]UIJ35925.1 hypothetical protein LVQ62_05980 [Allobranchiibius sp. GilTou73]